MASNMSKTGKYLGVRIPKWQRLAVYFRDGFECKHCGFDLSSSSPNDINLDHMVPNSMGGSNAFENLFVSCQWCNKRRQDKTIAQFHPGKQGEAARRRIARAVSKPVNVAMAKQMAKNTKVSAE